MIPCVAIVTCNILWIELGKFLFLFQCRVTKEFVHSNHKIIRHPFWKNSHICIDMRKTTSRGHSCSEGLRKKVTKRNSYKRLISYNWFCGPNTAKAVELDSIFWFPIVIHLSAENLSEKWQVHEKRGWKYLTCPCYWPIYSSIRNVDFKSFFIFIRLFYLAFFWLIPKKKTFQ